MLHTLTLHLEIDSEDRLITKLYDKRDDFNFPIVNFPFICSNIPAALAYGVCFLSGDTPEIVVLLKTTFIQVFLIMNHWWNRNCLPFWSTRVHPRILVVFVLLNLQCFVGHFLSFCVFFVPLYCQFTTSNFPFLISSNFSQS